MAVPQPSSIIEPVSSAPAAGPDSPGNERRAPAARVLPPSVSQAVLNREEPIGLLAGAGDFPIQFARAARQQQLRVHCVGVQGMVSDQLPPLCDGFNFSPLARLGRTIRYFKRAGVNRIVMAGKIDKTVLFRPHRIWRLLPDWRTLRMWYGHATRDKKDDTLLLAVIAEFARDGLQFESALDYCPEILVKHGILTRRQPSAPQWKDIRLGWETAKEIGRLDIGQSVMVKDGAVLAVEAIEGTDNCIRRGGDLCRRGGFTVVKVAKPQQDMRFDVPTIGTQTIRTMQECGAKVLAVECDKTIILDQPEVIRLADSLGIAVVAINAHEMELRQSA